MSNIDMVLLTINIITHILYKEYQRMDKLENVAIVCNYV